MVPEPGNNITQASVQGLRAEQQDRWVNAWIETSGVTGRLLAVIDGHGGVQTAERVARELAPLFQIALSDSSNDVQNAVRTTFERLNALTQQDVSGTTLSMVFVPDTNKEAYVGVLGDSPVVILNSDGHLWFSPLHNVRTNLKERAATLARGGAYISGYLQDSKNPGQGLQLTRTLGDAQLGHLLNREPELHQEALSSDSFILLATDGILDSFDTPIDAQLRRQAHLIEEGYDPEKLTADALARQTGDNVTVILWKGKTRRN